MGSAERDQLPLAVLTMESCVIGIFFVISPFQVCDAVIAFIARKVSSKVLSNWRDAFPGKESQPMDRVVWSIGNDLFVRRSRPVAIAYRDVPITVILPCLPELLPSVHFRFIDKNSTVVAGENDPSRTPPIEWRPIEGTIREISELKLHGDDVFHSRFQS
jgi:hypothetical protein